MRSHGSSHSRHHRPKRSRRRRGRPFWADYNDDELLDLRFCDLGVSIEGTEIEGRVERLYRELEARDIPLRPHVWLSTEWFSPDGVPGIAVPFYLAHDRLKKLEKRMMLEVEGSGQRECLRLLRHETGHTICSAYRLHYSPRWRRVFGKSTERYPDYYQPKPYSRNFVVHLDWWYAQAHPLEDFAETFAVWLAPGSRWRQQYRAWPALRKLELVDELMKEIAGSTPPVRSRRQIEPLSSLRTTLRQHYQERRARYLDEWPDFYDRDLLRIFSNAAEYADSESAAGFLRRVRPQIRQMVARWTGEHTYTVDQVLRDITDRCKEMKLRLALPENEARTHLMLMVAVQTMNFLHGGHHRIAL